MFNFKKIVAGIAVGAMVMGSGVAAFAGNGVTASDGKVVQFAAYYSSTNEWKAAPHGMNDENIASDVYDEDEELYVLTLKEGTYNIPMGETTVAMGGKIVSVTDANGDVVSVDSDNDGYADTVAMIADNGVTKYTLNVKATMNAGGATIPHSMSQQVYLMAD